MPHGLSNALRAAARIAMLPGAAGSAGLMAYAGRHNNSRVLLLLFGMWVLSPFLAAILADRVSQRWPAFMRAALRVTMLVLTLGSLAVYGVVAFGSPHVKTGFIFLVVPFASWLILAVIVAMATVFSRGVSRRGNRA